MESDASVHALGAFLLQSEVEDEYTTLLYSPAPNAAHRNYSTNDRELMAVVLASAAFRVYRLDREFTRRRDTAGLSPIFSSARSSTSRVAKWLLDLQPFRFTLNRRKCAENVVADKFSSILCQWRRIKLSSVINLNIS